MVKIKFCGAAHTVTGSNYYVETEHGKFVVDCGMFQGPDVESRNLEDFTYNPGEVSFALLTHAHIDHSGMMPKLVKHGFKGEIYATNHTIAISTELLLDSAKIQESNFERGMFYGKFTKKVALVYNTDDSMNTISKFRAVNFNEEFSPVDGIKIKYIRAGHVLGAASIQIEIEDEGKIKKFLFSGDIGREKDKLIQSFDTSYRYEPDYILMESLYGGQVHPKEDDSVEELINIIKATVSKGGSVFIPCFALQRAQTLINDFREAKEKGKLDDDIPFFLDSPLAQRITAIYMTSLQNTEKNIFDFDNLVYVRKHKQSLKLSRRSGIVIMAGSGMADGGRIMEHLATGLSNGKNAVVFVGFQAEGTLGRELVEGAKVVNIGGTNVKVNASINHLQGFSAHGDSNDYLNWLGSFFTEKTSKIYLIHAEVDRAEALKSQIKDKYDFDNCYIPDWKEEVTL